MEQHCCSSSSSLSTTMFDAREIEVCKILVNLKPLICLFESGFDFDFNWVRKRSRSRLRFYPNPDPLRHLRLCDMSEDRDGKRLRLKVSPDTPLDYSGSGDGSDEIQRKRKIAKKRTTEEWLELVKKKEKERDVLKGEVEKVKMYHNKLKTLNLELKAAMKTQVESSLKNPESESEDDHQRYSQQDNVACPQPSIVDRTAGVEQRSDPSCNRRQLNFDLNVVPEEDDDMDVSQPLDHSIDDGLSRF